MLLTHGQKVYCWDTVAAAYTVDAAAYIASAAVYTDGAAYLVLLSWAEDWTHNSMGKSLKHVDRTKYIFCWIVMSKLLSNEHTRHILSFSGNHFKPHLTL